MTINPKNTCLVLDLDDTLYKEYDYQTSGLKYIEDQVLRLYGINVTGKLLELRDQGVDDIFLELVNILKLPFLIKESFIMMYRYHKPDIVLTLETKNFIKSALSDFKYVVILTDGYSISQRLKIESLGLIKIPLFISEEWNSIKPDNARFVSIMEKYSTCSQFCYVADNPSKDFVSPNALEWISICLKGDKKNIHSQNIDKINKEYLPKFFINNLSDIYTC
jgi:putative hydrolase of the HAD superfamily|tara:strand:- start:33 stop:695 length:663 start_codon:yes stop_codon:yes gene_type:complete